MINNTLQNNNGTLTIPNTTISKLGLGTKSSLSTMQNPGGTTGVGPVSSASQYGGLISANPVTSSKSSTPVSSGGNTGLISNANIQNQLTSAQTQLQDLQKQQAALTQYGLTDTNQLTKDASGNYTPIPNPNNAGTNANYSTGGTNYSTGNPPTYSGLVSTLGNTASTSSQQYQDAQKQYLDLQRQIADLDTSYANATADIKSRPSGLTEQQGSQGILEQQYATKRAALTGQLAGAQQAAGIATGQQNVQQTGLIGAAGFAAPQTANALGTFNPITGQYSQYGGASGGGAATAGAVGTQINQGASVQQMAGQQTQAQALASNLSDLIDSAGINPADKSNTSVLTSFVNGVNQWLNGQAGDPKYQNFANLINEISSRYASILNQSGGTPTDQSTISHSIINGLAGGKSIKEVLASLDKNATDSINALRGAAGTNAVTNANTNTTVSGYSGWGAK